MAGQRPSPALPRVVVPLTGVDSASLAALWARVAFTAQAESVRDAVRSVHPGVEQVGLIEAGDGGPVAVVKLAGQDGPVPMASLGDGVQRAFGLLLALYAARGGLLLVDEIDTGLHFRVMEPLWKLLLAEARKADVQIVATTHSDDAIQSLAAAAEGGDEAEIAYIRLDARGGKRQAFVFDGAEAVEMLEERTLEVR